MKSIHERYADLAPRRMKENPRDEEEQAFADEIAKEDARKIWDHFGSGSDSHRKRVIMLLAEQALKAKQQTPEDAYE